MPKDKPAKVPVPQTREEADAALGRLGALHRALEAADKELTAKVAALKAAAAEAAAPAAAEAKALFAALVKWAQKNRRTLCADGAKSVALAQGQIAWRTTPPKVEIAGDEDALIDVLLRNGLKRLVRENFEIDRQAILREPGAVSGIAGIEVVQSEVVVVTPIEVSVELKKTVATAIRVDAGAMKDAA